MFEKKGHFRVPREAVDEERLMEIVLEAGADDMVEDGEHFEVSTTVEGFHEVQQALEQAGVATSESAVVMEPTNTVELEGRKAEQCLRLLETLQDHEDVQNVYANLEVDDSALETGAA
jgi:transcriptional/translational regulatory protein YebC/TACO1